MRACVYKERDMGNKHSLPKEDVERLSGCTQFSPDSLQDLYKCFQALDKDHSGELDRREFRKLWSTRFALKNVSATQIDRYFDAFDTDGNGTVSFTEFATALSILGPGTKRAKLEYLFDIYDEDKNGVLTSDEIDKILHQMFCVSFMMNRATEKDSKFIQAIVRKLDVNLDGEISREEWINVGSKTPSLLIFLGVLSEEQGLFFILTVQLFFFFF